MSSDTLNIIERIHTIIEKSLVDKIIKQLRQLIADGQIAPGEKPPSEQKPAEKSGVGRSYVRKAINKLEFYGLLKTLPQSETYFSGYNNKRLEGPLSDVIKLKVNIGANAVGDDTFFHFKIVAASKNQIFESMMPLLMPDIIILIKKICEADGARRSVKE